MRLQNSNGFKEDPFNYSSEVPLKYNRHWHEGIKPFSKLLGPLTGYAWQTALPVWGLPLVQNGVPDAQFTFGTNFSIETSFQAIQLILANTSDRPQTLGGILAAPSAFAVPRCTPCDASGKTVPWSQVSVAGNTRPTLPAAHDETVPSITLSDVIWMKSLPRADGNSFPTVFTRILSPPPGSIWRHGFISRDQIEAFDQQSGGRGVFTYFAGGDFTNEARDLLTDESAEHGGIFTFVAGIRFLTRNRCLTLLTCGDSLTGGLGTTSDLAGFGMRAAARLSGPDCFVSHAAHGWPGQQIGRTVANALLMLDIAPPDIMTCVIDSPNDYTSILHNLDQCRTTQENAVLSLARNARERGVLVVLLSPIPFGEYDNMDTYGSHRCRSGNLVRKMSDRGILKLDAQLTLCGHIPLPGQSAALPSHLRASDGAHLNDEGHRLLANALCEALQNTHLIAASASV